MDNKVPAENTAAQRKKRYPILPYLFVLLVMVVLIILLSYFSRQNSQLMMEIDAENDDNIEIITDRLDSTDERIKQLEEKLGALEAQIAESTENTEAAPQ